MFDSFSLFSDKPKRLGFVLMFGNNNNIIWLHYVIILYFVGFFFCILSLLCALVLALFDKRAEKILRRRSTKGISC